MVLEWDCKWYWNGTGPHREQVILNVAGHPESSDLLHQLHKLQGWDGTTFVLVPPDKTLPSMLSWEALGTKTAHEGR